MTYVANLDIILSGVNILSRHKERSIVCSSTRQKTVRKNGNIIISKPAFFFVLFSSARTIKCFKVQGFNTLADRFISYLKTPYNRNIQYL